MTWNLISIPAGSRKGCEHLRLLLRFRFLKVYKPSRKVSRKLSTSESPVIVFCLPVWCLRQGLSVYSLGCLGLTKQSRLASNSEFHQPLPLSTRIKAVFHHAQHSYNTWKVQAPGPSVTVPLCMWALAVMKHPTAWRASASSLSQGLVCPVFRQLSAGTTARGRLRWGGTRGILEGIYIWLEIRSSPIFPKNIMSQLNSHLQYTLLHSLLRFIFKGPISWCLNWQREKRNWMSISNFPTASQFFIVVLLHLLLPPFLVQGFCLTVLAILELIL